MVIWPAAAFGGTAGDRRIEVQQVLCGQTLAQFDGESGRDGGATDDQAARTQRGNGAVLAKQHGFGLLGIDYDCDDHIAGSGHPGRRITGNPAFLSECFGHTGAHITGMHGEAATQQRAGNAQTHRTQADNANVFASHAVILEVSADACKAGIRTLLF